MAMTWAPLMPYWPAQPVRPSCRAASGGCGRARRCRASAFRARSTSPSRRAGAADESRMAETALPTRVDRRTTPRSRSDRSARRGLPGTVDRESSRGYRRDQCERDGDQQHHQEQPALFRIPRAAAVPSSSNSNLGMYVAVFRNSADSGTSGASRASGTATLYINDPPHERRSSRTAEPKCYVICGARRPAPAGCLKLLNTCRCRAPRCPAGPRRCGSACRSRRSRSSKPAQRRAAAGQDDAPVMMSPDSSGGHLSRAR